MRDAQRGIWRRIVIVVLLAALVAGCPEGDRDAPWAAGVVSIDGAEVCTQALEDNEARGVHAGNEHCFDTSRAETVAADLDLEIGDCVEDGGEVIVSRIACPPVAGTVYFVREDVRCSFANLSAESRVVDAGSMHPAEVIRPLLRDLFAGPSAAQRAAGLVNVYGSAELLRGVELSGHRLSVDLSGEAVRALGNLTSECARATFVEPIARTALSVRTSPEVSGVILTMDGDCYAFWDHVNIGECSVLDRDARRSPASPAGGELDGGG